MNDLHIQLYQQDIVWADPEANRRRIEEALHKTPSLSDIFIVPETFTTGFGDHMAALAEEPDGPTLRWAQNLATKHNFLFVGTWIVREGDHCYNRLHWVYPNGDFGYYDKAHTFRVSGEADVIARGTKRVVFEYKGWRIKPAVCYDLRFPKWLRNDNMDYDLLLVCANSPASRREAWMTLLKARAIENLCYVVGCNRTGIDGNGGEYSGDSLAVNYKGLVFADGIRETENKDAEMTIDLVLNKERLDAFRQKWPLYLDFD